jgi:hypothetical protein
VYLGLAGCSLQNFDALSGGPDVLTSGGSAGSAAGEAGRGGNAPIGGRGGASSGGGGDSSTGSAGTNGSGSSAGAGASGGNGSSSGGAFQLADGGTVLNLLQDPSFATGHVGWTQFGNAALADAPGEGRDGSQCLAATGRTETFAGPSIDLELLLEPGQAYGAEAWVRTSGTTAQTTGLSVKTVCSGEAETYTQLATEPAPVGQWVLLSGSFTAATCTLDEYKLYIEGPESGVDLYVDDVGLYQLP